MQTTVVFFLVIAVAILFAAGYLMLRGLNDSTDELSELRAELKLQKEASDNLKREVMTRIETLECVAVELEAKFGIH